MWRSVELIYEKSLGYCLAYGICNHFIIARNIPTYCFLDSLLRTLLTYLDKINHFHLCVTTVFALIPTSFPAVSLTWLSFPLHNELAEGKIIFHASCVPATKWCANLAGHQWLFSWLPGGIPGGGGTSQNRYTLRLGFNRMLGFFFF